MAQPHRLQPLLDLGVIDEIVRPLMSGKEADVFLVKAHGELRVAKLYKEAIQRSFKHRADYTEGRRVKNTRSQRAMDKRSKFGREQMEAAWRNAEVDTIYRLAAAGVRVPTPYEFVDGVLVMELIQDERGEPAPRLVDVRLSRDEAEEVFQTLLRDVIRMLLAGVVHGDLSDFNVLMSPDGPVVIDFPQATDPAFNRNAKKLFVRDVDNLTRFLARFAPRLKKTRYGLEIWDLYERNVLDVDSPLTGRAPKKKGGSTDVSSLLDEIAELEQAAARRREEAGIQQKAKFKKPDPPPAPPEPSRPRPKPRRGGRAPEEAPARALDAGAEPPRKRKRRRRRKKRGPDQDGPSAAPPRRDEPPREPPAPPVLDDLDAFLQVEDD